MPSSVKMIGLAYFTKFAQTLSICRKGGQYLCSHWSSQDLLSRYYFQSTHTATRMMDPPVGWWELVCRMEAWGMKF